jgi:hypothetical protein
MAGELHHVFGGVGSRLLEEGYNDLVDNATLRISQVG